MCWSADDAVQAVWAGHACCLVQLDGVTFLTDPALSERVSGVQVCVCQFGMRLVNGHCGRVLCTADMQQRPCCSTVPTTVRLRAEQCTQCNGAACICVQWLGPRRITPNPLDLSHTQLPQLDFVVLSHNHYDHREKIRRSHLRTACTQALCQRARRAVNSTNPMLAPMLMAAVDSGTVARLNKRFGADLTW
jgi:L-ascorbate metabolism protein UlaG (beta-lactamase superfamily)